MGYDFLAIKTLVARGHISGVGRQIGVGKESDIFEVRQAAGSWAVAGVVRQGAGSRQQTFGVVRQAAGSRQVGGLLLGM